ncbi:hypothetical protein WN943_002666 [Citrus x changshan-huyou]
MNFGKLLLLFLTIGLVESTGALKFAFDGFNTSKLLLYGNAKLDSGAISLTQDTTFSIERALYHAKIPLKHTNSSTVRSFETSFTFSITPYKGQRPGHGLVFIFVPSAGIQGAAASQYLGFLNRTNDGNMNNNVFGIDRKITAEMRPSLVRKITAELVRLHGRARPLLPSDGRR